MVYERLKNPAVIAHRGASAYAPENTLAAFALALEQGADALELDAMLSGDGQVMVIHDGTVNRTTNGQGKVSELSLPALQALDAGSWFGPAFAGEKIPTLDAVFTRVGGQIPINIELKNYQSLFDDLPEAVAKLVRTHRLENAVFFSSFNPVAIWKIQRLLPEVPAGMLTASGAFGDVVRLLARFFIPHQALHPHHSSVTPAYVQAAHRRGKKVFVYTVNDPALMRTLQQAGVDGFFTDDAPLGLSTLGR